MKSNQSLKKFSWVLTLLVGAATGALAEGPTGTQALGELNCTACHSPSEKQAEWILPKSAPVLTGIGTRVSAEWLQRYLQSPQQTMPGTTMPDVIHGNADQAEALTHYLFSLGQRELRRVMPDRAAVARGESLFHRIGCVACHDPQNGAAIPKDSLPLTGMADKWALHGLRDFLLDPLATRPSGRMPGMNLTKIEAEDIAHYLLRGTRLPASAEVAFYKGRIRSLDALDSAPLARTIPSAGLTLVRPMREKGAALRITTWLTVKQAGDYAFFLTATGASRLSINGRWVMGEESWDTEGMDEKYHLTLQPGHHELRIDHVNRGKNEPSLTLEWKPPGGERAQIPVELLSHEKDPIAQPTAESEAFVVDRTKAETGRELFKSLNCSACHEEKSSTQKLPDLASLNGTRGCLADKVADTVPDYGLTESQRAALRTALATLARSDHPSPDPRERTAGLMSTFRCTACHSRNGIGGVSPDRSAFFTANVDDLGDEGRLPPRLDDVGDKLQPEWLQKVLGEGAAVRPYLNTRMPKFGSANVGQLADLFVAIDRHALPMAPVKDPAEALRDAGRLLVGSDGLSCIACHRFNRQPAHSMQVLDLTNLTDRLNEDWFRRFLRDPNLFHPGTRMPALWPNGKSLLPKVLDGDTDRQHAAIWTYLKDGPKARFPEGLSRKSMELIVGGEAVVYRGKLWESGFRSIATGFPGQVNAAFDAEDGRLAIVWRGRFLDASPHWSNQGMGSIQPLGSDVTLFPQGSPFAILADSNTPWPDQANNLLDVKFKGYQLDASKRPILHYTVGGTSLEDSIVQGEAGGNPGLHRTMKFSGAPPSNLHLRLASGQLVAVGDGSWRLNSVLTLSIHGNAHPFIRGKGESQELLVAIPVVEINNQLVIDYVW